MNKLDKMPRNELLELACFLTNASDIQLFDPYTDEQLRLLITSKAIEHAINDWKE